MALLPDISGLERKLDEKTRELEGVVKIHLLMQGLAIILLGFILLKRK